MPPLLVTAARACRCHYEIRQLMVIVYATSVSGYVDYTDTPSLRHCYTYTWLPLLRYA